MVGRRSFQMFLQSWYATRFPGKEVEFYNCGVAGDVAGGMLRRMESDILVHDPHVAFLMTGMNDIGLSLYADSVKVDSTILARRQGALDNYYVLTDSLVALLLDRDVAVVLMTPTPYDETAEMKKPANHGGNEALAKCAQHIRNLAEVYSLLLVDLHASMTGINVQGQQRDSSFTIVGADRVHPGEEGHFIMAAEIIKAIFPLGSSRLVVNVEDCLLSKLKKAKGLSVKYLGNSLPFPMEKNLRAGLLWVPFMEDRNKEEFCVNGLPMGSYVLQIDGITVDTFSSVDLVKGINLSLCEQTPQYSQALEVMELCRDYHAIEAKLRNIAFVEYRMLDRYEGPASLEGKRDYLERENESQKGKSWYAWNKKTCERYLEVVPHREELWKDLNKFRKKIYTKNIPQCHTYSLRETI